MKPIIRWTIGNVKPQGFQCLALSIKYMKLLYGDRFEYVICHNEIDPGLLKGMGADLIDATDYADALPVKPENTKWKFYPPRINKDVHEIVLDNDVILYHPYPKLEQFLESDQCLVADGMGRYLGVFEYLVPQGLRLNSGVYGLPPGFDFQAVLCEKLTGISAWQSTIPYDDQGILAAIVYNSPPYLCITRDEIAIAGDIYIKGKYGIHFVGLNSGSRPYHFQQFLRTRL